MENSKRFDKWWGKGSPHGEDAFKMDWGREDLWLNPPFSMLGKVVDKLAKDKAHALLVAPDWRHTRWHKLALAMSVGSVVFPLGTHLFQLDGNPVPGTKWPTRFFRICGHISKCNCDQEIPQSMVVPRKRVKVRAKPTKVRTLPWKDGRKG